MGGLVWTVWLGLQRWLAQLREMGGSDERDTLASLIPPVKRDGNMRFFTFTLLLMQVFHICASNGHGGHIKHSFLCPNGTLFQQQVRTKGKGNIFSERIWRIFVTRHWVCNYFQEEYGAFLSRNYLSERIWTKSHSPEKKWTILTKLTDYFARKGIYFARKYIHVSMEHF